MNLKRIGAVIGAVALLTAGAVVGLAAPASAHDATLTSSVACQSDGSATIMWTVTNDYNENAVITASDDAAIPQGSKLSPAPHGTTSKTFAETVAAPAAGKSVTATITVQWSDGYTQKNIASTAKVSASCTPTVAPTCTSVTVNIPNNSAVKEIDVVISDLTNGGASKTLSFTPSRGQYFAAGSTTLTFSTKGALPAYYKVVSVSSNDGKTLTWSAGLTCGAPVKDAAADVKVTPATCTSAGTAATYDLEHATLQGTLGENPGQTYTVTFVADSGHLFADGTSTKQVQYTVPAATGYQNTDSDASCYRPLQDASAAVKVSGPTCGTPGVPSTYNVVNATLNGSLDTTPGWHTATFTAKPGHVFANGTTTLSLSYHVLEGVAYQSTNPKADCFIAPTDASASVNVQAPGCGVAGTATTTMANAYLVGILDTSVGAHTATFKAERNHTFANGTTTEVVPYTILDAVGDQNANPEGQCYVPLKDAAASVDLVGPTCGQAGSATVTGLENATLEGELPTTPGDHTVTFDATTGHVFSDGSTTHQVTYTIAPAVAYQSTDSTQPCYLAPASLTGTSATGVCVANAPWIFYTIVVDNPNHLPLDSHQATISMSDGKGDSWTKTLGTISSETEGDGATTTKTELAGKVLWPGASVAADGVTPTGWPGYTQNASGAWVATTGNYAWTRSVTGATIEVNPGLQVSVSYPPATPNCDAAPPAPSASSGLADTGSNIAFALVAGGAIVVLGAIALAIGLIRRRRTGDEQ